MDWKKLVNEFSNESKISPDLGRQVESLTEFLEQVIARKEEDKVLQQLADFPTLAAKAFNDKNEDAQQKVQQRISQLSTDDIARLLRYYTVFFHLMNSQEQREISRINRERAIDMNPDSPRDESIAEAVYFLKEEGYSAREAEEVIGKLDIQPTITAHPTEARRHSVMLKQQHITKMIEQLRQSKLTPDEQTSRTMDILNEIHLLLATDEVRRGEVTVGDEVENGLFFFTNTIWDAIPQLYDDLRNAFNTYYNEVPDFSTIFRYRSWIGSDRDGNPNVTSEVTWDTLMEQRKNVFELYLEELDKLRRYLSISTTKYNISDELKTSLKEDREEDPLSDRYRRLYSQEPYRRKIVHIIHKIQAQIEAIEQGNRAVIIKKAQEYTVDDFQAELELIVDSLRESGLEEIASVGEIHHLITRARTFGFHMAALDIRQHSRVHEHAVSELLSVANVERNYKDLAEDEKITLLNQELQNPRPLSPVKKELSHDTTRLLNTFLLIGEMLEVDPNSFGDYIISMTHGVSDMLEVLILAKETGLWSNDEGTVESAINVVPLFETIEDLKECGRLMSEIYESELYQKQLQARNNFQEIMVGYSDSNKDGGYWMANWALEKGQQDLGEVCREYNVDMRIFHGRGGTVGRGGGRSNEAILALPPVSNNGRIRFTEQGEVISFRYSLASIARRHLEQIVNAVIRVTVADPRSLNQQDKFHQTMEQLSVRSMEAYRDLIDDEDFWSWFTQKTPIEHISRLPITSRPVSRGEGEEVDFEGLRAIPWVFSWTQVRYNVPGWYGTGAALHEMIEEDQELLGQLREWYQNGIYLRSVLDNAQREVARTHIPTSTIYDDHGVDKFHNKIIADFEKTKEVILAITEQDYVLQNRPVIKKSISFRNPFTYPLNMMQTELLQRWAKRTEQEDEQPLRNALFLSINGIAAAMQSTG